MKNKYNRNHVFDKEGNLLPIEQRTFITNESLGSYKCVIIDGGTKNHYILCKIEDYVFEAIFDNVKKGQVKYPFYPSVHKKGYLGIGNYKVSIKGKLTKEYDIWRLMIQRCYDIKTKSKLPTYENTTVCDEWLNFQLFAKWVCIESNYREGWHLDKDILSTSNKVYSPSTCVFIPHSLNKFIANKYLNNTTGYTGVFYDKNRWRARIVIGGKQKYLGYYNNKEEASKAYNTAREVEINRLKILYEGVLPENVIKGIK